MNNKNIGAGKCEIPLFLNYDGGSQNKSKV